VPTVKEIAAIGAILISPYAAYLTGLKGKLVYYERTN
jgi:hypothetical protein